VTLSFAKVIPRESLDGAATRRDPGPALSSTLGFARVVPAALLDAERRALQIVEQAERRAQTIIDGAHAEVGKLREELRTEVHSELVLEFSRRELGLQRLEAQRDERALDRSVELARLLAERLLGHALSLDPTLVVALARQALSEIRNARRIKLHANPNDVPALRDAIAAHTLEHELELAADPSLLPGNLVFESELGQLKATLSEQLARLGEKLRGALSES